jgi:hypothetical protein
LGSGLTMAMAPVALLSGIWLLRALLDRTVLSLQCISFPSCRQSALAGFAALSDSWLTRSRFRARDAAALRHRASRSRDRTPRLSGWWTLPVHLFAEHCAHRPLKATVLAGGHSTTGCGLEAGGARHRPACVTGKTTRVVTKR